jgi:nucleotide-binding universal stress UspA family protein
LLDFAAAVADFRRARYRAAWQEVMDRLRGRSTELLSYEEVRRKLKASATIPRGLQEIPLDAIIGSVGRYTDFTRNFLPRKDSDESRWAGIKLAIVGSTGLPPIDLYQVGEAYFVLDGNHRVSVARELGLTSIQAYVIEVRVKVPLSPGVQPDDLIIKSEYVDFLEKTHLADLRPQADLTVTAPGKYPELVEHIDVHRHFMGLEWQREIAYEEAASHWYDVVYQPVIATIREQGILLDFPDRTETDLYLWLAKHRAALADELGWSVDSVETEIAAADLADQFGTRTRGFVSRLGEKILSVMTPNEFNTGPLPGQWRRDRLALRQDDRLFADILVPVSGEEVGWYALEQAIEVARREGGRLHGLHVVPHQDQRESAAVQAMADRFTWRCGEVALSGDFTTGARSVTRLISDRARWTDLVVVNLAHPPAAQPLAKLSSGFRTLLRRCPRPVLVTPGTATGLTRGLLAYDGSPKAREALFIATYLAGRWQMPLVVVTVAEKERRAGDLLTQATDYLAEHGVSATSVEQAAPVAEAIMATAVAYDCDWLLMGGYGLNPVVEVVIGSTLDQVLRECALPILICR